MSLDAMGSLRELVQGDATVLALLGESTSGYAAADRVFVNSMPQEFIADGDTFHPPKTIVLRHAGGPGKADLLPTEDLRVNVLTYGESDFEADRVRRAVYKLFKFTDRECISSVLIHNLNPAGGPVPLTDPDIVWPAMSQAFTLTADTEE